MIHPFREVLGLCMLFLYASLFKYTDVDTSPFPESPWSLPAVWLNNGYDTNKLKSSDSTVLIFPQETDICRCQWSCGSIYLCPCLYGHIYLSSIHLHPSSTTSSTYLPTMPSLIAVLPMSEVSVGPFVFQTSLPCLISIFGCTQVFPLKCNPLSLFLCNYFSGSDCLFFP